MVLILPEAHSHSHSADGSTTAGLLSSIQAALAMGCDADMSRVTLRILGSYVIIEGLIPDYNCVQTIADIAEDIAGKGRVSIRLFQQ
nr:hypothetical protein [uncultured Gellertiella sp.]